MSNRELWKHWFPGFLVLVAGLLAARALRRAPTDVPPGRPAVDPSRARATATH